MPRVLFLAMFCAMATSESRKLASNGNVIDSRLDGSEHAVLLDNVGEATTSPSRGLVSIPNT
ncbi:hypothetical protein RND81_05G197400 [Saponaria officinalis]|uniref:Uncharacterized protein n=1 Tax=Saponaria officinalis TaxID=3572 RepID=A0AAW1KUD3_SAPOF